MYNLSNYMYNVSNYMYNLGNYMYNLGNYMYNLSNYMYNLSNYMYNLSNYMYNLSNYMYNLSNYMYNLSNYMYNLCNYMYNLSNYMYKLLFGSTNDVTSHLQRIQNYAARVIFRLPMSSSITIHLKSLHWLPVKVRSTYKIACLCYHCHSSTAPSYVTDMLHKKPLHTRNTRSSSYTMPLLNRPAHSKATLGDRSFSFASSSVWNSIPNDVRCAPSLSSFKSRLKTYLLRSVYID